MRLDPQEVIEGGLRPCPFCGSTNLVLENLVDADDYYVRCESCDVQQIANYSPIVACKRWNRREAASQGGEG